MRAVLFMQSKARYSEDDYYDDEMIVMMMMMMMMVCSDRCHVIAVLEEENSCIHIPQTIATEETVPGDERGVSSVECEYKSSRQIDDGGH